MRTPKYRTLMAAALLIALLAVVAVAGPEDDARALMEANRAAVVTVRIVTETTSSYEGETSKDQSKTSATGAIVDPSGLVVTALTGINARERFQDLMEQVSEAGFSVSSRVVDAKIKLEDGTELPADLILRDRDLDLAFLKPKKAPEKPMPFIDLSQANTPKVMDQLVILERLGQVGNWSLAANMERVSSVLTKPRTVYFLPPMWTMSLGCPAFGMDGKPAGLVVLRAAATPDLDEGSPLDSMMAVVMPCSTIATAVEHAKTAKPAE